MLQRKISKFKICILLRVVVNGLGIILSGIGRYQILRCRIRIWRYEYEQKIRQWGRLLDAIVIYQILYANSIAAMRSSQGKSIDSDVPTVYRQFLVPVLLPRTGGKENWLTTKYYSWSCFWTIPKKFLNSRINLSVDCACHYYITIP